MIHKTQFGGAAPQLNLNYPTSRVIWDVDRYVVGTVQAVAKSDAAWGTATVKIVRSNSPDGPWEDLPTAMTLGPDNFMSDAIDLDFGYLSAEIVADETADEYIDLYLWTGGTA